MEQASGLARRRHCGPRDRGSGRCRSPSARFGMARARSGWTGAPGPGHRSCQRRRDLRRVRSGRLERARTSPLAELRRPRLRDCDEGPHPVRRHPDGSYGPLGYVADDTYWAVDQQGRRIDGCAGAVSTDGTWVETKNDAGRVEGEVTPGATTFARKDGVRLWEHVEDGFFGVVPGADFSTLTVRDRSGIAYAAMQGDQGGRVVAVDRQRSAGPRAGVPRRDRRKRSAPLDQGPPSGGRDDAAHDLRRHQPWPRLRRPATALARCHDYRAGARARRGHGSAALANAAAGGGAAALGGAERAPVRGDLPERALGAPGHRPGWPRAVAVPHCPPDLGAAEIARDRVALATKGDNLNFDSGPLLFLVIPDARRRRQGVTSSPSRPRGESVSASSSLSIQRVGPHCG